MDGRYGNKTTTTAGDILVMEVPFVLFIIRAGPRDVVAGGALEIEVLNGATKAARGEGESMKGG